jgi:hypothetical protein
MFPSSTEVLPYVQIAAGVATALGFFFTFLAFRRVEKTEQIKLAEKMNDSIIKLDQELASINNDDEDALSLWDARLFNTLEWYSFLVNKKKITDKDLTDYFKDAVIHHFRTTFQEHASDEEKEDKKQYPEFKELYRKLTYANKETGNRSQKEK